MRRVGQYANAERKHRRTPHWFHIGIGIVGLAARVRVITANRTINEIVVLMVSNLGGTNVTAGVSNQSSSFIANPVYPNGSMSLSYISVAPKLELHGLFLNYNHM